MIRAVELIRVGRWKAASADSVLLAHEERHRRRIAMQGEAGLMFLLDPPEATALRHGDGLLPAADGAALLSVLDSAYGRTSPQADSV